MTSSPTPEQPAAMGEGAPARVAPAAAAGKVFGFDGAFLQRLERLALISRRPLVGATPGPRRSPRRGSSVEFADFREYSPGDDFRRIDWKAYGRLDRLFLRLYTAEEISTLTLFLDHSASMRFGTPAKNRFAGRLAATFAYIALRTYDLVSVAGWSRRLDVYQPPRGGTGSIPQVWNEIARVLGLLPGAAEPAGGTNFTAFKEFGHFRRGAGLAIILSDMLSDSDWQAGIRALRGARQEVHVIQIMAPDELAPPIRGAWKLQDAETLSEIEVTVSPRVLKEYSDRLEAHTAEIAAFCKRSDVAFLRLSSDTPLSEVVLGQLRAGGILT